MSCESTRQTGLVDPMLLSNCLQVPAKRSLPFSLLKHGGARGRLLQFLQRTRLSLDKLGRMQTISAFPWCCLKAGGMTFSLLIDDLSKGAHRLG